MGLREFITYLRVLEQLARDPVRVPGHRVRPDALPSQADDPDEHVCDGQLLDEHAERGAVLVQLDEDGHGDVEDQGQEAQHGEDEAAELGLGKGYKQIFLNVRNNSLFFKAYSHILSKEYNNNIALLFAYFKSCKDTSDEY